jgi:hypothetical protein
VCAEAVLGFGGYQATGVAGLHTTRDTASHSHGRRATRRRRTRWVW